MKTNVLISFLLLACVDAIGQQQDRLLHYETERAIYVYPDNPGYRDATPLTNAYRQEDLTDEEWEEQKILAISNKLELPEYYGCNL